MRYTKAALAIFGVGLLAGFVIVIGEFDTAWDWVPSAMMALGLVLLPAALFADGHGFALLAWFAARLRRGKPARPRAKARRPASRRKPAARGAARTPRRRRG